MSDFGKAVLIGIAITFGLLVLPFIAVMLLPVVFFIVSIVIAWIIIRFIAYEAEDDKDDDHKLR
jgi:membrane protein implicated in regulation of membrane protease activity